MAPNGFTATAASCGQVDLSWNASMDTGGSGLKAYTIYRNDGVDTTISIGSARTTFSDTNYLKSSTTMTYYVVAKDSAGNASAPSASVTVTTPSCLASGNEQVVDSAYIEPLGKTMATYGARKAFLFTKQNAQFTLDTWLYVRDEDTGQSSRVLLHGAPAYRQIETDYVLTSTTELWTLSYDSSYYGGKVLVSQYKLNGSPVSSATLISARPLGDSNSRAKAMIKLQSGGLMVAWNEEPWGFAGDLNLGFAYRSPNGAWAVKYPVQPPNSTGGYIILTQMALAEHPSDRSIWAFFKRDSFAQIGALHFTEGSSDIALDWMKEDYINHTADGNNAPEGEFPFLAAAADASHGRILLGYQGYQDQSVFTDPLYGNGNSIFLKKAPVIIAQVGADSSKTFIPSQNYMERGSQFGMSVLSDGTIWLAYQPINSQTYTWNEVYASKYQGGSWETPVLAGLNYKTYNVASAERDPGALIYRADQPEVAFLTPDQKVHTFALGDSGPSPSPTTDVTPPTTAITSPATGATVTGTVTVAASASDNTDVTRVEFLLDGSLVAAPTSSPYAFTWGTTTAINGNHTLQSKAYDAAGNVGLSSVVSVNVSNTPHLSDLTVAITSPGNGATVARNQKVTINATAADSVPVTRVQFFVNNKQVCSFTSAPYACLWRVPAKTGIVYNIKANATDLSGTTASQTITVTAQ